MLNTGINRKLDALGRIVIPKEIRDVLGVKLGDGFQVFVDEERVVLRAYVPGCTFCDEIDDLIPFRGRNVCTGCHEELKGL